MPADRKPAARASRVDAAAERLYALAPGEFIATRGELAKQARADGDAEAARDIARLAKPTVAAWFANQLARQQPADLAALLELGETLRSATAQLDAGRIRELSADRRRLVGELLNAARRLGDDSGQPMSGAVDRAVEETLQAALADPEAADRLRAGRLATPLAGSGFPGLELAAAAPAPRRSSARGAGTKAARSPAAKSSATGAGKPSAAGAAESSTRSAAKSALRAAETTRSKTQRAMATAERRAQRAADAVERLENQLTRARQARADADKSQRKAVRAAADADRAVRTAKAGLDRAR